MQIHCYLYFTAIYSHVTGQLSKVKDDNPWANVVAVGVDNTNSNIGKYNSIKSRLAAAKPAVYVHRCPCHILHNTAKKGAKSIAQMVTNYVHYTEQLRLE